VGTTRLSAAWCACWRGGVESKGLVDSVINRCSAMQVCLVPTPHEQYNSGPFFRWVSAEGLTSSQGRVCELSPMTAAPWMFLHQRSTIPGPDLDAVLHPFALLCKVPQQCQAVHGVKVMALVVPGSPCVQNLREAILGFRNAIHKQADERQAPGRTEQLRGVLGALLLPHLLRIVPGTTAPVPGVVGGVGHPGAACLQPQGPLPGMDEGPTRALQHPQEVRQKPIPRHQGGLGQAEVLEYLKASGLLMPCLLPAHGMK